MILPISRPGRRFFKSRTLQVRQIASNAQQKKHVNSSEKVGKRAPAGYWSDPVNQKKFFDDLSTKLGFADLSGWYSVAKSTIHQHGGGGMLYSQFNDSVQTAVKRLYPEHEWIPWRFKTVARDFWSQPENVAAFFAWAASQLNIIDMDQWYNVDHISLSQLGAAGLLANYHNNSVISALKQAFPGHQWLEWRAKSVPRNFWSSEANQKRFLAWVMSTQGRHDGDLDVFYHLSLEKLIQLGGKRILQLYNYSVVQMTAHLYPKHDWQRWKFDTVSLDFWSSLQAASDASSTDQLRKFMDFKASKLGIQKLEDWYRISRPQIDKVGGMSAAIRVFGGLPSLLVRAYPDHSWDRNMFGNSK